MPADVVTLPEQQGAPTYLEAVRNTTQSTLQMKPQFPSLPVFHVAEYWDYYNFTIALSPKIVSFIVFFLMKPAFRAGLMTSL